MRTAVVNLSVAAGAHGCNAALLLEAGADAACASQRELPASTLAAGHVPDQSPSILVSVGSIPSLLFVSTKAPV